MPEQNRLDELTGRLERLCMQIREQDQYLHSFVSDTVDTTRIMNEATTLYRKFHVPDKRSRLFGRTLGVKDIINVDHLETRCGTALPSHLFRGSEAHCIDRLKRAGMLVVGKTQTTEFACIDPGPTRNPLDPAHTPGGSSSGSAAAVAAGFCDFALGTQTIGSVIRPAAYCGIVGFKPTYDRIPVKGVFPFSETVDTVGFFCAGAAEIHDIAPALLDCWGLPQHSVNARDITLGVPDDAYLSQADDTVIRGFGDCLKLLEDAGYRVKRTSVFNDIDEINRLHQQLISGEMYRVHRDFLDEYRELYRPLTIATIDRGKKVDDDTLARLIDRQRENTVNHTAIMASNGVDFWLAPATATLAPAGLESTGDPIMNLPFTHLGLPTVCLPTLPANALRHGLQIAGPAFYDEELAELATHLAPILDTAASA